MLRDTYGVIAYQEQVMRIARDLAGFTLGEADLLRKAMGKKDPKVMAKQRERFENGAAQRGLQAKKATKIFDLMEYFAGYGFNKSHSTAYALLAYQTAYLKANYPPHFMAALLTIESQNTDKLALYLGECRDIGRPVLPPDVNVSELQFTVERRRGRALRPGRDQERRRGRHPVDARRSRRRDGPIASLDALCEDVDLRLVNKRVLESLVKAGALDSLAAVATPPGRRSRRRRGGRGSTRRRSAPSSRAAGGRRIASRASRSCSAATPASRRTSCRRCCQRRRRGRKRSLLRGEKEALGLYLSGYPLARARRGLARPSARSPSATLAAVQGDAAMGGIVSGCRIVKTRKGDRMAVFMLEDQPAASRSSSTPSRSSSSPR